jgi:hypothetical protein
MSLVPDPDRLNRINPAGGEPSTDQVRKIPPESVAVTDTEDGVPAPVGMATEIEPIAISRGEVVFVTVIVYKAGEPVIADVGLIKAVYVPVFCTLMVRETLVVLFCALSNAFAVHVWLPSVRPAVLNDIFQPPPEDPSVPTRFPST